MQSIQINKMLLSLEKNYIKFILNLIAKLNIIIMAIIIWLIKYGYEITIILLFIIIIIK